MGKWFWEGNVNRQVSYSPMAPWEEHDCEANAGQRLCRNKDKHS